jgi:hypothetical protein
MMLKTDSYFIAKGATHYHDAMYPPKRVYNGMTLGWETVDRLFARHYFRADGLEIGYYIPDLNQGPHDLDTPRAWGIPHLKRALVDRTHLLRDKP